MTVILAVAVLWLALDLVLVAGWHTAHVIARRPHAMTGASPSAAVSASTAAVFASTGAALAASTVAGQTGYRFERERPTFPRPLVTAAATLHS